MREKKSNVPALFAANTSIECSHPVVPGKGHRLPDVPLRGLPVAHEDVGAVRGLVQVLAAVGHAAPDAQALLLGIKAW